MKQKDKSNHKRPRKAKKFRSLIVANWLIKNYKPCKVADIGGGKGLLSYILNKNGWESEVIDPTYQTLPKKYTDLEKKKHKIDENEKVPFVTQGFQKNMAEKYDLLVGLHTHGSNINIIEVAKEMNKDFLILPCCVIDEPIEKQPNINWRESLKKMALEMELPLKEVQFNFMGKNIALYTDRFMKKDEKMSDEEKKKFLIYPIRYEDCDLENDEDENEDF